MKVWLCLLPLLFVPLVANSVIPVSTDNRAYVTTPAMSIANTGMNCGPSKSEEQTLLQQLASPTRREAYDRAVRISWATQRAVRNSNVSVAYVFYASRISDIQVILRLPMASERPMAFKAGPDSFVVSPSARHALQLQAQEIFRTIAARKIKAGHPEQSITLTFVQRWSGREDVALYRASMDFQALADPARLAEDPGESTFEPQSFNVAEFRRALRRSWWLQGDVTTHIGVITNTNFTNIH